MAGFLPCLFAGKTHAAHSILCPLRQRLDALGAAAGGQGRASVSGFEPGEGIMGKGKEQQGIFTRQHASRIRRGARQGATGRGDAERAPFSFRLLGIGFWQAWWMLVLCTSLVLPSGSTLHGRARAAPGPCCSRRLGSWLRPCCRFAAGTVRRAQRTCSPWPARSAPAEPPCACFCAWPLRATRFRLCFMAALLTAAFGNAFLLVMWGELWATLATDRVSQYLLSSYAFAFVLFFGVQALPSAAGLPQPCAFCPWRPAPSCMLRAARRGEGPRRPNSPWTGRW